MGQHEEQTNEQVTYYHTLSLNSLNTEAIVKHLVISLSLTLCFGSFVEDFPREREYQQLQEGGSRERGPPYHSIIYIQLPKKWRIRVLPNKHVCVPLSNLKEPISQTFARFDWLHHSTCQEAPLKGKSKGTGKEFEEIYRNIGPPRDRYTPILLVACKNAVSIYVRPPHLMRSRSAHERGESRYLWGGSGLHFGRSTADIRLLNPRNKSIESVQNCRWKATDPSIPSMILDGRVTDWCNSMTGSCQLEGKIAFVQGRIAPVMQGQAQIVEPSMS